MTIVLLVVSVGLIIFLTVKLNVHPFLALFFAALFYGVVSGMVFSDIVTSINEGFGITLGKIGMVIVLGVIIGSFLEHSGGAYKMADFVLRIIGKSRVHEAMGIIGYLVSIPVFADSGFIVMDPLNKSLSKRAKHSLAGTAIALILGLMLTHTMVPPTPGPLAAAGILNADIGLVMGIGLPVSALTLIIAIVYAKKYAAKTWLDPAPNISDEDIARKTKNAPGTLKSFLPIIIPILLIVGKSFTEFFLGEDADAWIFDLIGFIGTPVIALTIGMLLAFLLPAKWDKEILSTTGWVGKALTDAAIIILITGAGGIFGKILQNSGIADDLSSLITGVELGIWLPFILAAAIKTAQGSSTVALITTASILAPMMTTLGFESDIQRAILVVAIGAGSAVVSHANDSGFWVVTQLTGMDIKTGYRLYSFGTLIAGVSAATILYFISLLFPG